MTNTPTHRSNGASSSNGSQPWPAARRRRPCCCRCSRSGGPKRPWCRRTIRASRRLMSAIPARAARCADIWPSLRPAPGFGAVLVIHENRGLNAHIEDVARRLALAGFAALAPDLLSAAGGTAANEDQARDMIEKLDRPTAVADAAASVAWLRQFPDADRKVGAVGFCWGGGMVNRARRRRSDARRRRGLLRRLSPTRPTRRRSRPR